MMPQHNQTHEAVASLKLELVAAIRGAFEVAVELAVREVTDLVGQTTDKYLEVLRKENESLRQRWKRGRNNLDPVVERGRVELGQQHLQNNDSGCSTDGQNTVDPNFLPQFPKQQCLSMKDKVSASHLEEELYVISSDEDTVMGYVDGDMVVCTEKTEIAARNMRNNKKTTSTIMNVKQEKIEEENSQIKVEDYSLRSESEQQSALSVVLEEWKNIEPQASDIQLPSSRQIEELTVDHPPQADISNGHMMPIESVITGSLLQATEVHVPPSTVHNIYNTLGQTVNATSLTQNKRTSPFRCTICYRGFNYLMNLKTHLRIHTGERPYTCPICSRCFRHSNALTRHVRIHTGEKPYNCGWCGKSFRHLAGLKIHQRSHK